MAGYTALHSELDNKPQNKTFGVIEFHLLRASANMPELLLDKLHVPKS